MWCVFIITGLTVVNVVRIRLRVCTVNVCRVLIIAVVANRFNLFGVNVLFTRNWDINGVQLFDATLAEINGRVGWRMRRAKNRGTLGSPVRCLVFHFKLPSYAMFQSAFLKTNAKLFQKFQTDCAGSYFFVGTLQSCERSFRAVRVSTERDGTKNRAVFPVSRFGQRNGSRASPPSADCITWKLVLIQRCSIAPRFRRGGELPVRARRIFLLPPI